MGGCCGWASADGPGVSWNRTYRQGGHVRTYSQQIESQALKLSLEEGLSAHADQH